jgi:hypothetical protein
MSFSRHKEIYRSDVGLGKAGERQLSPLPALIGFDEFPVGYSLAGCPPAEPASASPTGNNSQLPYNDFSANGNNPLNSVSQPKGALHNCRPFPPRPPTPLTLCRCHVLLNINTKKGTFLIR